MPINSFDLYSVKSENLESAKNIIEDLLDIELAAHDSSYHCGEYYRLNLPGEENFVLQKNYDDTENEWTEKKFSEHSLLFFINSTKRSDELKAVLLKDSRLTLLQHDEI